MSRIRTIKPEFFKHEDLFDLEQETGLPVRLVFIGIWTQCDREGRFEWRPRKLKTDIMPFDDLDFSRVLDALATRGFIVKYEVEGKAFGSVPSFSKHQVINTRERASDIPQNPQDTENASDLTRAPRVDDACPTRYDLAQGERELERERIDDDVDGIAGLREPEICHPEPDALRGKILTAIGADPVSGMHGPNGKALGGQADMLTAGRWVDDLGLTQSEILTVIAETIRGKRDGPPNTFRYFDKPMQQFAGAKARAATKLIPSEVQNGSNYNHQSSGQPANRHGAGLTAGFAAVAHRLGANA